VVFGEHKRGRAAALGLLLGLPLLAATAVWSWAGRADSDAQSQHLVELAPAQSRAAAGSPGPALRAGWRKASPITRGQDLGLRFRPDERAPAYGEVIAPGGGRGEPREQADFRPVEPRRKPTYEELQAREQATEPALRMPSVPYPALPPPLPPPYRPAPW
jgi:hypothetical protein